MYKISFLLFISVMLIACDQNKTASTIAATSFDSNYQPANFSDAGRMEKIMQAFPIIDKIFKDYADSNHLPGVAYGLVVDGKLVYKGNIGYTDIEKKIPVIPVAKTPLIISGDKICIEPEKPVHKKTTLENYWKSILEKEFIHFRNF